MHEFELGVWKKVFVHILRILDCIDGATSELDRRYGNLCKMFIMIIIPFSLIQIS